MKYNINELEKKFKNIDEKCKIIEEPIYIEKPIYIENSTYLENKEDILQLYLFFILSGYIYCMKHNVKNNVKHNVKNNVKHSELTEYEVD